MQCGLIEGFAHLVWVHPEGVGEAVDDALIGHCLPHATLPMGVGRDGHRQCCRNGPDREPGGQAQIAQVSAAAAVGQEVGERNAERVSCPLGLLGTRGMGAQFPAGHTDAAGDADEDGQLVLGKAGTQTGRPQRLRIEAPRRHGDTLSGHKVAMAPRTRMSQASLLGLLQTRGPG